MLGRIGNAAQRGRDAVRTHGVGGVAREATGRLRTWAHRVEQHHWWELDLTTDRPGRALDDAFTLRELPPGEIHRTADLPMINYAAATERYAAGATFWAAMAGEQAAFGVWVFPERLQVTAARGGWVRLPTGVIGLEDGATATEFRRSNVALGALAGIADHFRAAGAHAMVAKTAVDNRPVFMLLTRAGYTRVASMTATFAGPLRRIEVTEPTTPTAQALAALLTRTWPWRR